MGCDGFSPASLVLCHVLLSYSKCVIYRIGVGEVTSSNLVVPTKTHINTGRIPDSPDAAQLGTDDG